MARDRRPQFYLAKGESVGALVANGDTGSMGRDFRPRSIVEGAPLTPATPIVDPAAADRAGRDDRLFIPGSVGGKGEGAAVGLFVGGLGQSSGLRDGVATPWSNKSVGPVAVESTVFDSPASEPPVPEVDEERRRREQNAIGTARKKEERMQGWRSRGAMRRAKRAADADGRALELSRQQQASSENARRETMRKNADDAKAAQAGGPEGARSNRARRRQEARDTRVAARLERKRIKEEAGRQRQQLKVQAKDARDRTKAAKRQAAVPPGSAVRSSQSKATEAPAANSEFAQRLQERAESVVHWLPVDEGLGASTMSDQNMRTNLAEFGVSASAPPTPMRRSVDRSSTNGQVRGNSDLERVRLLREAMNQVASAQVVEAQREYDLRLQEAQDLHRLREIEAGSKGLLLVDAERRSLRGQAISLAVVCSAVAAAGGVLAHDAVLAAIDEIRGDSAAVVPKTEVVGPSGSDTQAAPAVTGNVLVPFGEGSALAIARVYSDERCGLTVTVQAVGVPSDAVLVDDLGIAVGETPATVGGSPTCISDTDVSPSRTSPSVIYLGDVDIEPGQPVVVSVEVDGKTTLWSGTV